MKKQFSNLDEWLDWQQTLHSKNIDFKLERIKSVYKKLKINKIAKKVIIVAGTNGKGSTVALLENILHENGDPAIPIGKVVNSVKGDRTLIRNIESWKADW